MNRTFPRRARLLPHGPKKNGRFRSTNGAPVARLNVMQVNAVAKFTFIFAPRSGFAAARRAYPMTMKLIA